MSCYITYTVLKNLKRSNVYRNNTDVLALFCVQLTSSFLEFRSLLRFLVALTNVQVSEDQINFVQVGLFILLLHVETVMSLCNWILIANTH